MLSQYKNLDYLTGSLLLSEYHNLRKSKRIQMNECKKQWMLTQENVNMSVEYQTTFNNVNILLHPYRFNYNHCNSTTEPEHILIPDMFSDQMLNLS